jgi:chorismate mutase
MTETDQLRHAVLALLIFLALPPWSGRADTANEVLVLRRLMIERLALMEQVAAYKWNNELPIDNPVREANVLKAVVARSRAAGLDPKIAQRFVVAQMEAAKTVQRYYFDLWRKKGGAHVNGAADLVTELRPRIGALSADLIAAMANGGSQLETCSADSALRPVPPELSDVPRASNIAVDGVLGESEDCP